VIAWIAVAGLYAIAIWVGSTTAYRSGNPGNYYEYRHLSTLPAYPLAQVLESGAAIVILLAIASYVIHACRSVGVALFLLALLLGIGVFCMAPVLMHAPPYFIGPFVFAFFAAGWCLAMVVVAVICAGVARLRS
jgi:hypothetical protein